MRMLRASVLNDISGDFVMNYSPCGSNQFDRYIYDQADLHNATYTDEEESAIESLKDEAMINLMMEHDLFEETLINCSKQIHQMWLETPNNFEGKCNTWERVVKCIESAVPEDLIRDKAEEMFNSLKEE